MAREERRLQIGEISDYLCSRIDVPWRQQQARLRLGGKHCVQRRPGLHRREDLRRVLDEHLHKAGIESPAAASLDCGRWSFGALKQLDVVGEMRDARRKWNGLAAQTAWHTRSVPALEDAAQALDNASPEEQTLGELLRHLAVRLNKRRPMPTSSPRMSAAARESAVHPSADNASV
jgi:hypothetical protein